MCTEVQIRATEKPDSIDSGSKYDLSEDPDTTLEQGKVK